MIGSMFLKYIKEIVLVFLCEKKVKNLTIEIPRK